MNTSNIKHNNQNSIIDKRDTSFSVFGKKDYTPNKMPLVTGQNEIKYKTQKKNLNENESEEKEVTILSTVISILILIISILIAINSELFSSRFNIAIILISIYCYFIFGSLSLTAILIFIRQVILNIIKKFKELFKSSERINEKYSEKAINEMIDKSLLEDFVSKKKANQLKSFNDLNNSTIKLDNLNKLNNNQNSFQLINNQVLDSSQIKQVPENIKRNTLFKSSSLNARLLEINSHINFDEFEYQNTLNHLGLNHYQLKNYIKNIKNTLINKTLPNLTDYNLINLNTINKILKVYSIQIVDEIINANISSTSYNDIKNRLLKHNMSNLPSSTQIQSEIRMFWADNKSISFIIDQIEIKLNKINNMFENQMNNTSVNIHKYDFNGKPNKNVAKFNLLTNTELSTVLYNNKEVEDSLIKLKSELEKRVEFNRFLYTDINHPASDENHYFILLDYIVKRLASLINNSLNNYDSCTGGPYSSEINWSSLFPTDAEIIMEIVLKSIHNAIVENNINITKCLQISFPFKPSFDNVNSETIMVYKINPSEYETHYDLIDKTKIIKLPRGKENVFINIIIFMNLLKKKIPIDKYRLNIFFNDIFGN